MTKVFLIHFWLKVADKKVPFFAVKVVDKYILNNNKQDLS